MADEDSLNRHDYIVSLIENRAMEVGMAAFDFNTASIHLNQYIESSRSYQNTLTLLQFFNPKEIIISSNSFSDSEGIGAASLADNSYFRNSKKISLHRGCFNEVRGSSLLQTLISKEYGLINLQNYQKQYYLSLGAVSALLKWVECDKGLIFVDHTFKVTFNGSFNHLTIDCTSVQNLEIIDSLSSQPGQRIKHADSLFKLLNTTKTIGGSRMLKANLLQPLKDLVTINTRLECLEEILSNEELYTKLSQIIQKFPKGFDKVISNFAFQRRKIISNDSNGLMSTKRNQNLIANIILLKEGIEMLPYISEVLSVAKCSLLSNINDNVCKNVNFNFMHTKIKEIVEDDVLNSKVGVIARTQQCFAVRAGVDGFLDLARKSFCETSEAIHALGKVYREKFNFPTLKLLFNSRRGFFISIPSKDVHQQNLPKEFVQVMKQGKAILCSTQELASLNIRNKESCSECFSRTEICLEGLCKVIRTNIRQLALLSESMSLMDMMTNSFAFLVSTNSNYYTKPEFTENGPLAIDSGRHPFGEKIISENFIANNTFLSEASNMMIVTGPNMSGKSTYLRQVVLLTIMAHIGCYIPAKFASFRLVDRIFTRIGSEEKLEANSSTFMNEMRETSYIMQNITPKSLVVLDELGSATSTQDGISIAWSCCEHFLSLHSYVIFATHMERLCELGSIYPNIKICYFSVNVENDRLDYKYVLKEGTSQTCHYGIMVAEMAAIPTPIIAEAKRIAESIERRETKRLEIGYSKYLSLRKVYHVVQRLLCLQHADMSKDNLRQYLAELKKEYDT